MTIDLAAILDQSCAAIRSIDLIAVRLCAMSILNTHCNGGTVLTCGNGGSAAHASHLTAELVGRFEQSNRPPIRSVCLNADMSVMTAIANDFGYANVFANQISTYHEESMLIAFSTSGTSENVRRALAIANDRQMESVIITGGFTFDTGSTRGITVDSLSTARIQEAHQVIIHLICALIDEALT